MRRFALAADDLRRLPVFPLPRVTLFPHATVPLHVFEPRYKALVRYCLQAGRPLAVWQLAPSAEMTPFGPRLHAVGTAGCIRACERLPGGRFDIVVEGIERVRFVSESESGHPFRMVESVSHALEPVLPGEVAGRIDLVWGIARALAATRPEAAALVREILEGHPAPSELSDALCSATDEDGAVRQRLLELSSVPARLDHAIGRLASLLLHAGSTKSAQPPLRQ